MISYEIFTQFLQNGLPDATGGVMSAIVISLWNKAKGFFVNSPPTQQDYTNLLSSNQEFLETITHLSEELQKAGAISTQNVNNYGTVQKQTNIGTNYGPIS